MASLQLVVLAGQPVPASTSPVGNAIPMTDGSANLQLGSVALAALTVAGSLSLSKTTTITTTATLDGTLTVARCDATSAAFTLTLPTVATAAGKLIVVKKIDVSANLVTVQGNGSELIDGANTFTGLSAQWKTVGLYCNGTTWDVVFKF